MLAAPPRRQGPIKFGEATVAAAWVATAPLRLVLQTLHRCRVSDFGYIAVAGCVAAMAYDIRTFFGSFTIGTAILLSIGGCAIARGVTAFLRFWHS